MKTLINTFAIFFLAFIISSCDTDNSFDCISGLGTVTSTNLTVSNFTGIDLAGSSNVTARQGLTPQIVASGHPNILELIKTDVFNNIWTITLEDGCYDNFDLNFDITIPDLSYVGIRGSGDIVVNDFAGQGDLSADISGSGNITFNQFDGTENFDVEIAGSGNVTCATDFANLSNLEIDLAGSGSFRGFSASTDQCDVNIAGSGIAEVTVTTTLNVSISGSGSVFYKDNPIISQNITGSGAVINSN